MGKPGNSGLNAFRWRLDVTLIRPAGNPRIVSRAMLCLCKFKGGPDNCGGSVDWEINVGEADSFPHKFRSPFTIGIL